MKFKKDDKILELSDPNTFSVAERYGFEPIEEKKVTDKDPEEDAELDALKAQAKELGIRNAHSMGKTKLIEKIAEAQKGAE